MWIKTMKNEIINGENIVKIFEKTKEEWVDLDDKVKRYYTKSGEIIAKMSNEEEIFLISYPVESKESLLFIEAIYDAIKENESIDLPELCDNIINKSFKNKEE